MQYFNVYIALITYIAGSGVVAVRAEDGCKCQITVSAVETSHVGIFDGVLRDHLFGGGGSGRPGSGSGGMDDLMSIILPDGVLPDDLILDFHPQPGVALSFATTQNLHNGMPVEIESFVLFDQNRFTITAPTGLGILADPTVLRVRADLAGIGILASVPVWSETIGSLDWVLNLGGGAVAYHSTTSVEARSALLDVNESESVSRIMPLFATAMRFSGTQSADPVAFDLGLKLFPTDRFWTGVLNAGLVARF
ncbi:hypothetical protein [Devosia sp. 2618]|uniref:hypothetical protein n=1 Tax=Devosia sp. 2618 TaxID=3156454 RepID=UPI0033988B10